MDDMMPMIMDMMPMVMNMFAMEGGEAEAEFAMDEFMAGKNKVEREENKRRSDVLAEMFRHSPSVALKRNISQNSQDSIYRVPFQK